ncbi:MAG: hypothetical protein RIQ62_1267 [Bacteroidota bacterium]|jgi:hypothetical protein
MFVEMLITSPSKKRVQALPRFRWMSRYIIVCYLIFNATSILQAQSVAARRYEIDAKRVGITFNSKDALPRGREFKRIDSTYYVGWMLEGAYKFNHAADYLGYQYAATQLEKALQLMQHDFSKELNTHTSDIVTYLQVLPYHRDWDFTAFALMQCYSNLDQPASVWQLLRRCQKMDMQDEMYMDTYNYLAWTIHRNRFYTNRKYRFLKNSIDEHESYANALLDSATKKIARDAIRNQSFYGPAYAEDRLAGVWHYKSILATYQLNITEGNKVYEKLRKTRFFPLNNYATFCAIQAKFAEAHQYYESALSQESSDKRLNESYYYLSILNTYSGKNKESIEFLKNLIKANGSTPGYGWYNLALSRALLYDGEIQLASRYAERAAQFKEIHIGTTLGQSHYDFTLSLLRLQILSRKIQDIKFRHSNWWYTPSDIQAIASLVIEKYGIQFLLINQFATNPERDRVIYKLFSTESTVSVDEVSQFIEELSSTFFIRRLQSEWKQEKREKVKPYYCYILARLEMKQKNYRKALAWLQQIPELENGEAFIDRLLQGRILQTRIQCRQAMNSSDDCIQEVEQLYRVYPQLIPSTGIRISMHLHAEPRTAKEKEVISSLKQSNIRWTNATSAGVDVYLQFTQKGRLPIIRFSTSLHGTTIIPPTEIAYDANSNSVADLLPALFFIGNNDKAMLMQVSHSIHP